MSYSLTQEQRDLIEWLRDGERIKTKFERREPVTHDKLDAIFDMQYALDQRIIDERGVEKTTEEWVRDLTVALEDEISEVRACVNWKWWKNPKPVDYEELRGEVIDLWHFLVSLSQKVGLTADDVYRVYCEKNAENHARQDGTSAKKGYEVIRAEVDE
jgi:dimeric dUTPase (all-alpha-NTP-PPase superfamily)